MGKFNFDTMARIVFKRIHSGVLNTVLDLAALFYFLVCLNMYFQGNEAWHEVPHNVAFFIPMVVVCLVAVCVLVYHLAKELGTRRSR